MKILFYSFHVPIFALVSGILLKAPTGFKDCIKKIGDLALRIMVPYTIWHLISGYVYVQAQVRTWKDVAKTYFFLNGMTIGNDALWYAPSFFMVAVVFYLICWAIKGNKGVSLGFSLLSFTGFTVISKLGINIRAFGYDNFLGTRNLLLLFGFLTLGYACKDCVKQIVAWKEDPYKNSFLYMGAAAFFALAVLTLKINAGNNISVMYGDYNDAVVFTILAILLSMTFVVACGLLPESRAIAVLSKNSFFIMCSHYLLMEKWLWGRAISADATALVWIRWNFAVSMMVFYVIVCFVAEKLCRKIPVCSKVLSVFGIVC